MANALSIHSPQEIDRNRYAKRATSIVEDHGGTLFGILTGVRTRPETPVQYYESSWIVSHDDTTVYISGLSLCEPDEFWDSDADPVTATVFTTADDMTPRQQYDRAHDLEATYRDPAIDDDERSAILDRYNARFLTATPDTEESLDQILSYMTDDISDDTAYHTQLGEEHWSRFDRPTASELLDA